jgi:heptosyltransferase-2/heptosyltransferase-3
MSAPPPSARHRLRHRLLQAAARLPLPPTHRPAAPPARVLVIRPDDLGDMVLATPALARLRAGLRAARVTVAAGPWAVAALRHAPVHDAILPIPFTGTTRTAKPSPIGPYTLLLRQARRLRAERFDAALILRPDHWWGALLTWAAGIPRRLGYATPEVALFCTETLPPPEGLHAAVQSLALVDLLLGRAGPMTPAAAPLIFIPTDEEAARADALLAGVAPGGPLVALHPGAGNPIKQWPNERWATVANALIAARGARILLTGSPSEAALTAPIAAALPAGQAHDLAGKTDLGALAALFARCDLVLGVDSGGLHIATATAPRTLRLYGPSDHLTFGPWGDPARHRLLRAGLRCPFCHNLDRTTSCPPDCMAAISAEQVIAAALDLLDA